MKFGQMAKEMEAGGWRGKSTEDAAPKQSAKPVPKPYMTTKYTQDHMRTTGKRCLLPLHVQLACIKLYLVDNSSSDPNVLTSLAGALPSVRFTSQPILWLSKQPDRSLPAIIKAMIA